MSEQNGDWQLSQGACPPLCGIANSISYVTYNLSVTLFLSVAVGLLKKSHKK